VNKREHAAAQATGLPGPGGGAELPLLLPARMLNEYVYCPRLFFYEHVEGVFVHNADTMAGAGVHKRVNAREDRMPRATGKEAAEDSGEDDAETRTIHSRSISLFSERLGVTAKLDLVESHVSADGRAGTVSPVEYKKGQPRETEEGIEIWDTDQMQLGLQILLLRDNGFNCDRGFLYYRETRQKIPFVLEEFHIEWIERTIEAARMTARGPIPEPLDHSPKCPRCSLVSICLPDETATLSTGQGPEYWRPSMEQMTFSMDMEGEGASTSSSERIDWGAFADLPEIKLVPPGPKKDIRRLIAPNPETKALYLNTPGYYVGKKDQCLVIKDKGKAVSEFRFLDLHHLALFGPVQISTGAVHALCDKDIPITYFSMGGWFYGMTRGHTLKNVFTRIEQFRQAGDPEAALLPARLFVYAKIRNQRTLLMRNHRQPSKAVLRLLKGLSSAALHARSVPQLLGVEGTASLVYFQSFSGMLKRCVPEEAAFSSSDEVQKAFPFYFDTRNRRPPRDPVNALLSLTYSLLAKECVLAAYAVGFDPYIGFLHQPRFGRPALALDLMEEFRPLVADSTVLTLINTGMVSEKDFMVAGKSVNLTPPARRTVFHAFEKRLTSVITHPVFGYKVSYRRAIELQARLLAKALVGEIEQYFPFTTR